MQRRGALCLQAQVCRGGDWALGAHDQTRALFDTAPPHPLCRRAAFIHRSCQPLSAYQTANTTPQTTATPHAAPHPLPYPPRPAHQSQFEKGTAAATQKRARGQRTFVPQLEHLVPRSKLQTHWYLVVVRAGGMHPPPDVHARCVDKAGLAEARGVCAKRRRGRGRAVGEVGPQHTYF